MKKFLIAALVLGFAATVFAQPPAAAPVAETKAEVKAEVKAEKKAAKKAKKAAKKAVKAEAPKTESAPVPAAK